MAHQEIAELLLDAAHVAQAQHRAPADRLAVGLDQPVGLRGQRHAEADAARPQGLDRALDGVCLLGIEPAAEHQQMIRRRQVGHQMRDRR